MKGLDATWTNGQVHLDQPADWPEGTKLKVVPSEERLPARISEEEWATDTAEFARTQAIDQREPLEFLTEAEQSDDPKEIQRWIEELRALPALAMTSEEEADMLAWRQRVKEYNLAAVRRQMEDGIP